MRRPGIVTAAAVVAAALTLAACGGATDPSPRPSTATPSMHATSPGAAIDPVGRGADTVDQAGQVGRHVQRVRVHRHLRRHHPAADHAATIDRPAHRHVNHCALNTLAQKAIVSLAHQHMWMCARNRTVHSTPITSGVVGEYTSTPTGHYWIQGRDRDTVLTLNTGATYDVKYWIPFDAPLFGFHDSSWQNFPYGSDRYKTEGSHGCVHMPLKAIAWFYRWVARPTAVRIS